MDMKEIPLKISANSVKQDIVEWKSFLLPVRPTSGENQRKNIFEGSFVALVVFSRCRYADVIEPVEAVVHALVRVRQLSRDVRYDPPFT